MPCITIEKIPILKGQQLTMVAILTIFAMHVSHRYHDTCSAAIMAGSQQHLSLALRCPGINGS